MLSWPVIIAIMMGVGFVTGVALGLAGEALHRNLSPGVGAAVGVVGAMLVMRRRAALAAQKKP